MLSVLNKISKSNSSDQGYLSYRQNGSYHYYYYNHQKSQLEELKKESLPTLQQDSDNISNIHNLLNQFNKSTNDIEIAIQLLYKTDQTDTQIKIVSDITRESDKIIETIKKTDLNSLYKISKSLHSIYILLCNINNLREMYENNNHLIQKQPEYLEFLTDSYQDCISLYFKINKSVENYSQDNLKSLLLNYSSILGNKLIIDQSCDITVNDPIKLLKKIEVKDEDIEQPFVFLVQDNCLVIKKQDQSLFSKIDLLI